MRWYPMTSFALLKLLVPSALAVTALALATTSAGGRAGPACAPPRVRPSYVSDVNRALRAGADVWGNELLAAPGGPTYDGVRRYLHPLLFARAAGGAPLTDSGVHYVAFSEPRGPQGAEAAALHVADGSEIISRRAGGPKLTIGVGRNGEERYGSCLARLSTPGLRDGYLPILETRYVDAEGVHYRQESFAARVPESGPLVSYVQLTADARQSGSAAELRFAPSNGPALTDAVPAGSARTVYLARPVDQPSGRGRTTLDRATYEAARRSVADYWRRRLAQGMSIEVPERHVVDAERNLLIQELGLTWRYSIGNAYEEFSFPEGVDVAEVLADDGFADVSAAILRTSLTRRLTPYPNWKMGQKLVGSALQFRLFRDRSYIDRVTPTLRSYVATLTRQISASPQGMLRRERYSSDIPDSVYGLHSQAIVWQGLVWMAGVWQATGRESLAALCRRAAARLEASLRRAVRESEQRLPDGSLFVPARLLDDVRPYNALTASRLGSYWNLVAPYAFASGLFPPRSREADGVLRYMLRHGSRLLGLVRAGAFALYGSKPVPPTSGTDEVYGLNVARFLADSDQADQLVLSLYGDLGAAMTPGTFVSGEAASVTPLSGQYYRSMYLPPNGAANATFLATLHLMLVHEKVAANGTPRGLQLAYSTPRAWLGPGKRIAVRAAPTSFGPISFSLESTAGSVRASIAVPNRAPLRTLTLRLRLPRGHRISSVSLDGRPWRRFDRETGTIELPTRAGQLDLVAHLRAT
jgi:hypothetical protein